MNREIFRDNDNGVLVVLSKISADHFELKIDPSYNFAVAYQKTSHLIQMDASELKKFSVDLEQGNKATYGSKSWLGAETITIKKKLSPVQYREIRLVDRVLVIGFHIVPATLTGRLVKGLVSAIKSV
ncbi:hypothetical protein [Microbulbifer sp. TRSA005]|uniref:hypothetical protein n=1 Tax=unclassified Microbulbifer TaxID=2619833 RepID=UPI0040397A58